MGKNFNDTRSVTKGTADLVMDESGLFLLFSFLLIVFENFQNVNINKSWKIRKMTTTHACCRCRDTPM